MDHAIYFAVFVAIFLIILCVPDRNSKIINKELGLAKAGSSEDSSEIFRLEILQYLILKGTSSVESYEAVIFHGYVDQIEEQFAADLHSSQSILKTQNSSSASELSTNRLGSQMFFEEEWQPLNPNNGASSLEDIGAGKRRLETFSKQILRNSKKKISLIERRAIFSDEVQRTKAVEYLIQSYVGLLDKSPNSVEVMLSFAYFLKEFTSLNNITRYQIASLEQMEMTLE